MNLSGKELAVTGSDGAYNLNLRSAVVSPVEATEVIAFLVSDQARAATGSLIPVVGRV